MARRPLLAILALLPMSGCTGELAAFSALAFSMTAAAWMLGRERARSALDQAENMRRAITSGNPRSLEQSLRAELALAEAGEAVSAERQWSARAQLGGLLVAEWRLDEARQVYGADASGLNPILQALADFGRHELAVLTQTPDADRLAAIQTARDRCLPLVPRAIARDVERTWNALEGLCLIRSGRAREAVPLLEAGLGALEYNPARVVYLFHLAQAYETIGERELAATTYDKARQAFPGTRLASEANARLSALTGGQGQGFRNMLPEAPPAFTPSHAALGTASDTESGNGSDS